MKKNSASTGVKRLFPAIFALCLMIPASISAQMFSIDTEKQPKKGPVESYTMAGLSLEWADFEFRGDPRGPAGRADFTAPVVRFRFESPGIRLTTAFGGSFTGMDDRSFTNINAQIENGIPLYRGTRSRLVLPFQLITDLLAVRPEGQSYEFQQSSLVFGTGLRWTLLLPGGGLMVFDGAPNYGFSFSQGSLFGGSLFRAGGGAKLFIPVGSGGRAIALGYHGDYRAYDIEGELNDYRYTSHAVTVGIGF